jgi:hypothetical protein
MDQSITDDPTLGKNSEHKAEPWAKIPTSWLDLPVSNNAKVLLWLLDQMQGNKPQIQVGQKYLSQRLKVSRHTITRAANELLEVGVITRRGTWGSSVYQVFNPARRSFSSNLHHEGSNPAPLEGSKVAPVITKEHLIKENKQTNQTEHAPLEGAASVSVVVSEPASLKNCNDQERSYVKAFAVSLENQIGGSVYPGSFKAETLRALLIALDQGYTAQEAASMCSQYYQQEQQSRALRGQEPIRSATRWLIAILPSVLSGAEAEPINEQIPDYLPPSYNSEPSYRALTEEILPRYFDSDNAEPMSKETKELWEKIKTEIKAKARTQTKPGWGGGFQDEPPF